MMNSWHHLFVFGPCGQLETARNLNFTEVKGQVKVQVKDRVVSYMEVRAKSNLEVVKRILISSVNEFCPFFNQQLCKNLAKKLEGTTWCSGAVVAYTFF